MQTKLPSCEASENGQKWQKNSWIRISGYRTSQNVIVYWSQAQKCHENSSILLSKPAGEPTDKLRKKQNRMVANKTRNTFRRTRNLSSATFSLLITWRSSRSKSAAVYKISSKSNDFSLRYGDISILKMAAVRHLGIVLPPYEPPTKSLLLAAAGCQISCQSDTQIWIFHIFGLKCLQAPKMEVLGDFGPINVIIHHRDPQKAHPCVNPRLLSYQHCKWGVWPVGELTESVTNTHRHTQVN